MRVLAWRRGRREGVGRGQRDRIAPAAAHQQSRGAWRAGALSATQFQTLALGCLCSSAEATAPGARAAAHLAGGCEQGREK